MHVFQKILDNGNARTGRRKPGTFRYRVTSCVRGSHIACLVVLTEHLSVRADILAGLHELANLDEPNTVVPALLPRARPPRRVQRRFTAAEAAEIVKQYLADQTMNELARAYGIHRRTVAYCLRKQGVAPRQLGLPGEHLNQAAALYRVGWSLARIGKRYGTTDMTVRRALAKHGVAIRPRRGWS
jgi:hypothetical protein